MKRPLAVLVAAVLLGGCASLREAALPLEAKINVAYPPAPETRAARERLFALLARDPAEVAQAEHDAAERLAHRARACLAAPLPDRHLSLEAVRRLPVDLDCLRGQDEVLRHYFGLRSIGVQLARPPLRPAAPVGTDRPLPSPGPADTAEVLVARDAGVAVLRSSTNHLRAIEFPSGARISDLPRGLMFEGYSTLSPNGRVLAITPAAQSTVYLDVETGARLWDAPTGALPLAWLSGLNAFLVAGDEGRLHIADGDRGLMTPHPQRWRHVRYVVPIDGTKGRVVLGGEQLVGVVDHERGPDGIAARSVASHRPPGPGVTSMSPLVMRDGGLLVYNSFVDIGWLDLRSGASGTWVWEPYFERTIVKMDETHLLIDSVAMADRPRQTWLFDVTRADIARRLDGEAGTGRLAALGSRPGYARQAQPWRIGDRVTTDAVEPLAAVLARMEAHYRDVTTSALTDHGRRPLSLADSLSPELSRLPDSSVVHMVGLYRGHLTQAQAAAPDQHPTGTAQVLVRPSVRPVVLVLSSFDPVSWEIVNTGAPIVAVLLSGYHRSKVRGIGMVPVVHIGHYSAHAADGAAHRRLRQLVTRYTGPLEIRSFQGAYEAEHFSVGD